MLTIGEFAALGQVSPRMLRHYDQLGLLRPQRVDSETGYRFYGVNQLACLHRLLALRDLGFGLDQIAGLLDDASVEQLRGMLRLRQAQIEKTVAEEQARLGRVDAHLRSLERNASMPTLDIVIKTTQPLRLAESAATSPGFGTENIGPVFARLVPGVLDHLGRAGATPGMMVGWYEEPQDDGSVRVHAGFDIGDQSVPDSDAVQVVGLAPIEVASVVHKGPMDDVASVYEDLVQWIEDSGYHLNGRSRELYLEWHETDPSANVTELQMPIRRR